MTDQQLFVASLEQMGAAFTELTLPRIIYEGKDAPDMGAYAESVHYAESGDKLPEFDAFVIFGDMVLHFHEGRYVGRSDQRTRVFRLEGKPSAQMDKGGVAISP